MAGRSQVLIDRLLRVAAERKARGFPFGGPAGPSAVEMPPAGPGTGEQASAGGRPESPATWPEAPAAQLEPPAARLDPPADAAARLASAELQAPAFAASEAGGADPSASGRAAIEISTTEAAPEIEAREAGTQADEAAVRSLAAEAGRGRETVPAATLAEAAVTEAATGAAGEESSTSLVYLLMRWGSLLSTLAHGTLEVGFGPHAATPVPAGAEALERILVNLVRNARGATALGGAIRIGVGVADAEGGPVLTAGTSLRPEAGARTPAAMPVPGHPARLRGTMVLTVDDSGCGMSEAQVRRILGEAAPAPDAPPHAGAAGECGETRRRGLGLQIVRQLVAASGGTLSIQSWPGRGTRVEIRWPVVVQAAVEALGNIEETAEVAAEMATEAATLKPAAGTASRAPDAAAQDEEAIAPAFEAAEAAVAAVTEGAAKVAEAPGSAAAVQPAATLLEEAPVRAARAAWDAPGGPVLAAAAGTPSRSLLAQPARETPREPVGPDGFSEAELRAMMLRLHRTGPQERSPLSRRLGERRPAEAKPAAGRETDRAERDHGFGLHGTAAPAAPAPGPGTSGAAANHAGWNRAAQQEAASKGAIAC